MEFINSWKPNVLIEFLFSIKMTIAWSKSSPTINSPNLYPKNVRPIKLLSNNDAVKKVANKKRMYGFSILFKIFIGAKNNISYILLSNEDTWIKKI